MDVTFLGHFIEQDKLGPGDVDDDNISSLLYTILEFSEEDIRCELVESASLQEIRTVAKAGVEQEI